MFREINFQKLPNFEETQNFEKFSYEKIQNKKIKILENRKANLQNSKF